MKEIIELLKNFLLIDFIISFISIDFNKMMINELEKQNLIIGNRRNKLKLFLIRKEKK